MCISYLFRWSFSLFKLSTPLKNIIPQSYASRLLSMWTIISPYASSLPGWLNCLKGGVIFFFSFFLKARVDHMLGLFHFWEVHDCCEECDRDGCWVQSVLSDIIVVRWVLVEISCSMQLEFWFLYIEGEVGSLDWLLAYRMILDVVV